jgi:hypothetical protein
MKITIAFHTDESEGQVVSSKTYDFSRSGVWDKLQGVCAQYEDEGITIDHGGDRETYELDLADGFSTLVEGEKLARDMMAVVEDALSA